MKKLKILDLEKSYQMTYISEPVEGMIYIAEPSRKGSKKLLWSRMPQDAAKPDLRIDPTEVPRMIRRQAYRRRYGIRRFLKLV